jgi:hypothetical protein
MAVTADVPMAVAIGAGLAFADGVAMTVPPTVRVQLYSGTVESLSIVLGLTVNSPGAPLQQVRARRHEPTCQVSATSAVIPDVGRDHLGTNFWMLRLPRSSPDHDSDASAT